MSDSTSFVGGPGNEQQAALYKGIGCALAVGSGKELQLAVRAMLTPLFFSHDRSLDR
jgi:hypothetical protein